jgi:hypothetical protein
MRKVITLTKLDFVEVYGSIVGMCREHPEFKFNTIKAKKFPFFHQGYKIQKFYINNPTQIDNR